MELVKIHLWSGLRRLTDGKDVVEVEARTVGEALDALVVAHPAVKPLIESGVSVVVDDEMITSLHHKITADNELYLMQRLKGG